MKQQAKPRIGLAVTSLVLGILSVLLCLGLLTGLPAIITGHVVRGRVRRDPGGYRGARLGLAGLILGYLSLLQTVVLALMLAPALGAAKSQAQSFECLNNLRQIGMAARLYAVDNREVYPTTTSQMGVYLGFSKFLVCPLDQALGRQKIDTKDFSRTSYVLTLEGASEATPTNVIAQCPFHNHTLTADGAVHRAAGKPGGATP